MSGKSDDFEKVIQAHQDDVALLEDSVRNRHSIDKVLFIYGRLKGMGPFRGDDLTLDLLFEIDTLHCALVIEYGRIFSSGMSKVSKSKVPEGLRDVHDEIMELRNKRYAHDDDHGSFETQLNFSPKGKRVEVLPEYKIGMRLGAPPHWEPLFEWVAKYLKSQFDKQLDRLSKATGYDWYRPEAPPLF